MALKASQILLDRLISLENTFQVYINCIAIILSVVA